MTNTPLSLQTYDRRYGEEAPILFFNRFLENSPPNQVEGRTALARPGDTLFGSVGDGPIRLKAYQAGLFDDDVFIVSGDDLYRWDTRNAPTLISGLGTNNSSLRVTFVAGIGYEHMFLTDTEVLYYYDGLTSSLHQIPTPDGFQVSSLENLDSFVLLAEKDTNKFWWITPGAVIVDALNFASAESTPSPIVQLKKIGDTVYMVKKDFTEVWYSSGVEDAPFIRQKGLAFNRGALENTLVTVNTQGFLVADDGVVYMIGGSPIRVSNNAIEGAIRRARKVRGI